MSTRSKFLKGVASFSALFMASTGIASASGPDVGDNFTVTFNGQASLSVGYQSGDLIAAPTIAGSTWGSPGAILSPPLSVLLGGGPLVAADIGSSSFSTMSHQYTRFGFTAEGDTAVGAFKARIEGDFNGAGNTLRLRHGYGQVGPILAGQTNSLWNEGHIYVSGWDWNGDVVSPGNNISRRLQLRYTTQLSDDATLAVAMESPSDTGTAFTGTGAFTSDKEFFDLTANLQASVGAANVTVSAIYSFADAAYDAAPLLGFLDVDGESYAVAASATMPIGSLDAGIVGVYSDGGAGMGRINNTAGMDTSWGLGATLGGSFTSDLSWHAGASFAQTSIFNVDLLPIELTREHVFATGSLTWTPAPQYSIIGQVTYESAEFELSVPPIPFAAGTRGEAVSATATWIYRM